ncbi:MAG: hypothetical protein RJB38_2071 [Pseudomonadota bacterium]|jgi:hypothetical protein
MLNRLILASFAMLAVHGAISEIANGGADCLSHPKSEWISEGEMKKRLEEQGYQIKKFKVDGNCYEIYGKDRDGKRVEIYFDTKTGAVVKSQVR